MKPVMVRIAEASDEFRGAKIELASRRKGLGREYPLLGRGYPPPQRTRGSGEQL